MKGRTHLTALAVALILGAPVLAVSPLGPPKAQIGDGHWGVGFDLSHQELDLEATGTYNEFHSAAWISRDSTLKIKNLESTPLFGRVGYGLNDQWDVFACLGMVNGKDDAVVQNATSGSFYFYNNNETYGLDGGYDFAWGLGTRFTLLQQDNVSWGGLFRMTWQHPTSNSSSVVNATDGVTVTTDMDLKFWEFVFAFGPTVTVGDYDFYGGPMIHLVRGDLDFSGSYTGSASGSVNSSLDVNEESVIGGYFGAQWQQDESLSWYVDGEATADAWGLGIGGIWRVR